MVMAQTSGIRQFLKDLEDNFGIEDQDLAWISIDRFFTFKNHSHGTSDDFLLYCLEWNRLFTEAETHGGLTLSEPAKAWLFWTCSGFSDDSIGELRLKVNGDLNRWREMVALQQRISKNESAAQDQHRGYKKSLPAYHGDSWGCDDAYYDGYDGHDSAWYEGDGWHDDGDGSSYDD